MDLGDNDSMVHSFELRLNKMFSEHGDALRVADQVLKEWNEGRLSWLDQEDAGFFLVQTGFFRAFFDQVLKLSKKGQRLPWGSFAEALGATKTALEKEDIDSILLGAASEDALTELTRSWALDAKDSRFAKIRSSIKRSPPEKAVQQKDQTSTSLKDDKTKPKLAVKTEASTLKKSKERDYSRAFQVVERSPERDRIASLFLEKAKANPAQAYEMAVALHLMGFSQEAIGLIPLCAHDINALWLEIELMIEAQNFLEALEKLEALADKSSEEPQNEVATNYLKALIVKGLKQDGLAIELMEAVVKTQPDYKSASTILFHWKESAQ
jgi:hypothetical protein